MKESAASVAPSKASSTVYHTTNISRTLYYKGAVNQFGLALHLSRASQYILTRRHVTRYTLPPNV